MDLAYVKKVLKLVEESNVNELELEEKGVRIRVTKRPNDLQPVYQFPVPVAQPLGIANPNGPVPAPMSPASAAQVGNPIAGEGSRPAESPPIAEKKYREVKSPIVGTFYRAPAPDAANYVEVGSNVQPGTVLCIVEAMKLMNEIECDVAGTIAKVCVENGKPVEYNQVLFLVDTE
ncbi:MAG: acetyl-CoA carboxylase biotin carboxyl carrier protein [Bacteroidota bacterium]|nr:acetyl-CoA carboxylase biotin carboxyl carrier protein [Bacteroidota bacterium]